MARTTSAKGKEPSQKICRGTWPPLEPVVKMIDFNTNEFSFRVPTFTAHDEQLVIFLVSVPSNGSVSSGSDVFIQFKPIPGTNDRVYAGALTATPGCNYEVICSVGFGLDTKTASGSIEVSGGGDDDEQIRGQRRNAVRQRASRSTRM